MIDYDIYVGPHPLYMAKPNTARGTILSHALNFVYVIGVMCVTGSGPLRLLEDEKHA